MKKHTGEIIKLENVSKIYCTGEDDLYALKDVNLTIMKNEFVGILGPSGSGKSTMLHILGLLDEPSRGSVYIDGIETNHMSDSARATLRGRKIGFVFQAFNLIPTFTVLENVALPALMYNVPEDVAHKKAAEILDRIGMGNRIHHLPNQLSGGQRQRAAIARALINNPEIILADEPTGNLDSKTGKDVLGLFDELHDEGKTIIIITHDQEITKMAEKTVRINDGMVSW